MTRVVGVDVGGTKVLAGVVRADGTIANVVRRDTPDRSMAPPVVEDTIADAVTELAKEHGPIDAVGVGAAGFVDEDQAVVRFSPHLSWRDEPLKAALERRLEMPVVIDNDANAAALAETSFGAARGYRHALCITLGTGIGGALVVDGKVFRGANGMAGEFGHMQVVAEGRRCECGNRGCWEQYSSGNALVREARDLVAANSPSAHILVGFVGGDPDKLNGPTVTQAAQAGDPASIEIFREVGAWLGVGLANLTAAFDPELIVVGGGVSAAGELLLEPAREALGRRLTGRGFRREPGVVRAALGPDAGFIGAAELARRSVV